MACVTVIGTGLLGSGIAEVLARNGHSVILHDFSLATLSAAHRKLAAFGDSLSGSLRAEPSLDDAAWSADYVLEAVTENLGLKQELFERVGRINRRAILMSNSSVLPIGEIAMRTPSPQRAIGTHWWNPPQLIPIVEVIRGPLTSDEIMDQTLEFHATLGKLPVRVNKDIPGFIGNRIQHALWREALALVSDAECEPQRVDRIVAATLGKTFADYGPWEQMQRIGWPAVRKEFESALHTINSQPQPAKLLRDIVSHGHLGAKTGAGFLRWEEGARERVAQNLAKHVAARLRDRGTQTISSRENDSLSVEDALIARRLRVAVWREAISLLENKVCTPDDLDRVVCNTIGLRLAAMGPVENADYVGLDLTLAIHEAVLPSLESSTAVPMSVQPNAMNQVMNI
jgi:3-hydroxybutyryl-CoA dehydrogenase